MNDLIQIQKLDLAKPSQILRKAYTDGVKKIEGELSNGNGFCAVGLLEIYNTNRDPNTPSGESMRTILNRMSMVLYNKKYYDLKEDDMFRVLNIRDALIAYNDSSPDVSFSDCADYLEQFGL